MDRKERDTLVELLMLSIRSTVAHQEMEVQAAIRENNQDGWVHDHQKAMQVLEEELKRMTVTLEATLKAPISD